VTSYVREVSLRLRVGERDAQHAETWRDLAEKTLLRNVLEALEEAIVDRLGRDAIVRIAHLPLRWRLDARELADTHLHRKLGVELAEGILADAEEQRRPLPRSRTATAAESPRERIRWTRPRAGTSIAVFVDEVHELAVAIADLTERAPAAFYHPLPALDALWDRVIVLDAVPRVVAWLTAADSVDAAVARAPAAVRARVSQPGAARAAVVPRRPGAVLPRATRILPGSVRPGETNEAPAADPDARPDPAPPRDRASEVSPRLEPAPVTASGDAVQAGELERHPASSVSTAAGGAFYVLASVLELELGEHLWCAGTAEGPVIAQAIASLAPDLNDDPAFAAIAGTGDAGAMPSWAIDEVVAKIRDSLGRWLARRGFATTADELASRLASLTGQGERVPAVAAAALAAMVCERLAVPWSREPAAALIARSGRIVFTDDELTIELPLASVTLEVRRAGLDRDPGWIPWLRRTVRIVHAPSSSDVW